MVSGRPGRNREEVQYCSHEAEKDNAVTVKSKKETRANREGTSKAGKGPLKHHAKNRKGPGQKREAQRASRAMRKHERAMRKQGRSQGKHGKTEAAGGRRGRQAGENRKGTSRIGKRPERKGDGP